MPWSIHRRTSDEIWKSGGGILTIARLCRRLRTWSRCVDGISLVSPSSVQQPADNIACVRQRHVPSSVPPSAVSLVRRVKTLPEYIEWRAATNPALLLFSTMLINAILLLLPFQGMAQFWGTFRFEERAKPTYRDKCRPDVKFVSNWALSKSACSLLFWASLALLKSNLSSIKSECLETTRKSWNFFCPRKFSLRLFKFSSPNK